MSWTKRSYLALFDWPNQSKRTEVEKILVEDELFDVVEDLKDSTNLKRWYEIVQKARAAIGPETVQQVAKETEKMLDSRQGI